ncbi:MAG: hypothetical protein U1F43_36180 [Myxococcota bacterium]
MALRPRALLPNAPGDDAARALEQRDADGMLGAAKAILDGPDGAAELVALLEDFAVGRGATRPIFVAHHGRCWSPPSASTATLAVARPSAARLPLLAAACFHRRAAQERAYLRLAHEALRFVRDACRGA